MRVFAHHRHSGRVLGHAHTSYSGLAFVLALSVVVLSAVTLGAQAAPEDPVSSDVAVNATVAQKTSGAPTITSPGSGTEVGEVPITVSGACASNYVVKVFANDIVVGAMLCQGGRYSIPISLFYGRNTLRAQSFNVLDLGGPSSASVGVTFSPPSGKGADLFQRFDESTNAANQLYLRADVFYRGGSSGQTITWPIAIVGGTAPYALNVSWGDGKSDVISRTASGPVDLQHTYASANKSYPVVIKAADAAGNRAYLQAVGVARGKAATTSAIKGWGLMLAWPLLAVAILMVVSFFLGERYEKRLLTKQGSSI